MADCTAYLGLCIFIMNFDRSPIRISSEEHWEEIYRTKDELLQDRGGHESSRNILLLSKSCKFNSSLATLGFMNFHPFHRLQNFLSLPITLRRVIKGISQLQKTPRVRLSSHWKEKYHYLDFFFRFLSPSPIPFFPSVWAPLLSWLAISQKGKENLRATFKCTRCPWLSTESCPCKALLTASAPAASELPGTKKC